MNTVIVTKNGTEVVIPNTDFKFSYDKTLIYVVDEIDHDETVGNFTTDNIAGIYTDNPVRLKTYEPDDD